jgi:hypothetical protein
VNTLAVSIWLRSSAKYWSPIGILPEVHVAEPVSVAHARQALLARLELGPGAEGEARQLLKIADRRDPALLGEELRRGDCIDIFERRLLADRLAAAGVEVPRQPVGLLRRGSRR